MIGSITTGSRFKGLIEYLFKPTKQPEIIGGNYFGDDINQIIEDFKLIASFRPTTEKPVKHFVISFAPEDGKIDNLTKHKIAMETVTNMGYTCNQWIAVAHNRDDPDHHEAHGHDHMHIAVNMVTYDGERISDSFDKWKMQGILRDLEIKYQLKKVASSLERTRRRPKQGRYKKFEQAYYKYINTVKNLLNNTEKKVKPPREPEIQELETIILAASDDRPTMTEFLARMQQAGYKVEEYEGKVSRRTGKPRQRFRYHLKSIEKPIHKVNGGSRANLLKRVDYVPDRDDPSLIKAAQGIIIDIPDHRRLMNHMVEKYRYGWLTKSKQEELLNINNIQHQEKIIKKNNDFEL